MSMMGPEFGHRVTVGGVLASYVSEIHAKFGSSQPVSTCSLTMPVELATTYADGDEVLVEFSQDGVWWDDPVFVGTLVTPERVLAAGGNTATLPCVGPCDRLTLPLEKDLVFTGGAKAVAAAVQTAARHIGNDTIAWYADTTGDGTSVSVTKTPSVDSSFVWVVGRLHGTNDYPTSLDDKTIKKWSRIEVWQDGAKIGYANFPESSEQYSSMLDYTNDANWTDFELFIAADIVAADGDITFKFISGQKPGATLYDEYEIKVVTWQTAGRNTLREIIRGIIKSGGFSAGEYNVNDATDIDGVIVKVGGNGLVDAGQLRITATESRIAWANGLVNLFGYFVFDCPDGIIRMRPIRGIPVNASRATFSESGPLAGIPLIGIPRTGRDASRVYNNVLVEGASGTDPDGVKFAYSSQTADVDVLPNDLIPTPPGVKTLRLSSNLLTTGAQCSKVREIQEVTATDVTFVEVESVPVPIYPTQTFTVVSATVGVDDEFFATSISYDVDAGGYRMSLSGERGTEVPFDEIDDPDEDEDDAEPTVPRPVNEWAGGYKPKASKN